MKNLFSKPATWVITIIIVFILIQYYRKRSCISTIKRDFNKIISTGIFPCGSVSGGKDGISNKDFAVHLPSRFPFSGTIIAKDGMGKLIEYNK